MKQWNEQLRSTLKGQLEHKLFLMWAVETDNDEADKLMQRLIDVRYERKKCEALANAKARREERKLAEEYDTLEREYETRFNRRAMARSHLEKAIHHLVRMHEACPVDIRELRRLKELLY